MVEGENTPIGIVRGVVTHANGSTTGTRVGSTDTLGRPNSPKDIVEVRA
jgi:hypothetical protein